MNSPVLTTKSILEALSDEWQPITSLIFKIKIEDMYDVRFLQIKLKELKRKGLVLVENKTGKTHWKLVVQNNGVEKRSVVRNVGGYFDTKSRQLKVSNNEIKFGVLGKYSHFGGTYELFLPVDTSRIKSKIYKKLIEDIGPFIGFSFDFNKDLISIRESAIFHMGHKKVPYLWDFALEKGLGSKSYSDVLGPDTKGFHYELNCIINPYHSINQYHINPNRYGIIEKFGFFSYGEEELILPLDLSHMKNDSKHQSIRKMLQEIRPIAGFLFKRDKSKNLLILLDDALFGDWYEEWDLKNNFFVDSFVDDITDKVETGEGLTELTSGFLIFISYSTKDSNKFNVPYLSRKLCKFPEIGKALFWENDTDDDIIDYMNKYVRKCDLFVLICSQNATDSDPVKMEWQAALKIKKKIIPIFKNESDIPALLSPKLGVKYDENDLEKTVNDIYFLILKKLKKKN